MSQAGFSQTLEQARDQLTRRLQDLIGRVASGHFEGNLAPLIMTQQALDLIERLRRAEPEASAAKPGYQEDPLTADNPE